jgi:hypothetical protein
VGVNIFILDRRLAKLTVAGIEQDVGLLRRFWKITELDEERSSELTASEAAVSTMQSPKAAMIVDVVEMPLASKSGVEVPAHRVIGWDEGRTSVTDMGWDYLPVLGFAVRDRASGIFALHEIRDGALHLLERDRALELGLIRADGRLVRRGQPVIKECRSVHPVVAGYAEADCTFDNGASERLWIATSGTDLPAEAWFIGKRPMDTKLYRRNSATPEPE